jgi:hypothetical protein
MATHPCSASVAPGRLQEHLDGLARDGVDLDRVVFRSATDSWASLYLVKVLSSGLFVDNILRLQQKKTPSRFHWQPAVRRPHYSDPTPAPAV